MGTEPQMGDIKGAHRKLTAAVMGKPGVSGTAIGQGASGPCLKVYLTDTSARSSLPKSVEGFKVVVEQTEVFRRF